jgi:hypothetical protein
LFGNPLDFMGEGSVHGRVARTTGSAPGATRLGRGMTLTAIDHTRN